MTTTPSALRLDIIAPLTVIFVLGAQGCSDEGTDLKAQDAGVGRDAGTAVQDAGLVRDAGVTRDAGVARDAGGADSGISDSGVDRDSGVGRDGGVVLTHYGIVSVADVSSAGLSGQIRGAFVPASEFTLVAGGRGPITGAPGCFEVLPSPPVVPTYINAGTLLFTGLVLANHTLTPNMLGDYSFDYAGLFEMPNDPITLSVPGAAIIQPMSATVATPDPAAAGTWSLGSTGVFTNWTAGNGDFVLLHFFTSAGERVCEVPDTGAFLVPATSLSPDDRPAGDNFIFQRVVETTALSASGTQALRFRAISVNQLSGP